jgi:hypothetical protein
MHKIGAEDSDILLEPRQDRLTDTKSPDGFLIGAGEQMLVVWRGRAEDPVKNRRKSEVHGRNPLTDRNVGLGG